MHLFIDIDISSTVRPKVKVANLRRLRRIVVLRRLRRVAGMQISWISFVGTRTSWTLATFRRSLTLNRNERVPKRFRTRRGITFFYDDRSLDMIIEMIEIESSFNCKKYAICVYCCVERESS